jgi:hypothetical protein
MAWMSGEAKPKARSPSSARKAASWSWMICRIVVAPPGRQRFLGAGRSSEQHERQGERLHEAPHRHLPLGAE